LDLQFLTNVGSSLSTDVSIIKGDIAAINFNNFGPNLGLVGLPGPHGYGLVVGHRTALDLINPAYRTAISQSSLNVFSEWNVLRRNNLKKLSQLLRDIARFNELNVSSSVFLNIFNVIFLIVRYVKRNYDIVLVWSLI
jgi:hypothetical protein